jgi:hypothetical protein
MSKITIMPAAKNIPRQNRTVQLSESASLTNTASGVNITIPKNAINNPFR